MTLLGGPIGRIPQEPGGPVQDFTKDTHSDANKSRLANTQAEGRGGVGLVAILVGTALAVVFGVGLWLVMTGRLSG